MAAFIGGFPQYHPDFAAIFSSGVALSGRVAVVEPWHAAGHSRLPCRPEPGPMHAMFSIDPAGQERGGRAAPDPARDPGGPAGRRGARGRRRVHRRHRGGRPAEGARVVSHPYSWATARRSSAARARPPATSWCSWTPTASTSRPYPRACWPARRGYDMVVGARDWAGQASVGRGLANGLYNRVASRMTGFQVPDLTSGFRAVRARQVPRVPAPAAERVLVPDHHHDGVLPERLSGRLRADPRREAHRQAATSGHCATASASC